MIPPSPFASGETNEATKAVAMQIWKWILVRFITSTITTTGSPCRASASVAGRSTFQMHKGKQPRSPTAPSHQTRTVAWRHAPERCAIQGKASLEVQYRAAPFEGSADG